MVASQRDGVLAFMVAKHLETMAGELRVGVGFFLMKPFACVFFTGPVFESKD